MKNSRTRIHSTFSAFILLSAVHTLAQSSVDWQTVDGGGALSSGGNYTLAGTIGQPDAGFSSGGNYALTGGFWGGAYQGPLPSLSIAGSGQNLVLHWPSWASGFIPLMKEAVDPETAWTLVPEKPGLMGDEFVVSIPALEPAKFYQLWLP